MGKQKRSANTYTKINTLFLRDVNNIIMPYHPYVSEELEWLKNCKFDAEEKVDGTNMRIELYPTTKPLSYGDDETDYLLMWNLEIKGKTDNAQIPKELKEFMETKYTVDFVCNALGILPFMAKDSVEAIDKGFSKKNEDGTYVWDWDNIPSKYTIYGEGYGRKIQACGSRYINDGVDFIGFDVKIVVSGIEYWLLRENRNEVFAKLNTVTCPYKGQFTIPEAIEFVKAGFVSEVASDKTMLAEGLVLRAPNGLLDRRGNRIIFKIKTCDFEKYRKQYGTDEPVEQVKNNHI